MATKSTHHCGPISYHSIHSHATSVSWDRLICAKAIVKIGSCEFHFKAKSIFLVRMICQVYGQVNESHVVAHTRDKHNYDPIQDTVGKFEVFCCMHLPRNHSAQEVQWLDKYSTQLGKAKSTHCSQAWEKLSHSCWVNTECSQAWLFLTRKV